MTIVFIDRTCIDIEIKSNMSMPITVEEFDLADTTISKLSKCH